MHSCAKTPQASKPGLHSNASQNLVCMGAEHAADVRLIQQTMQSLELCLLMSAVSFVAASALEMDSLGVDMLHRRSGTGHMLTAFGQDSAHVAAPESLT